jgi:TolB-like protein/tetratricopeptide (TPR) repeat protein
MRGTGVAPEVHIPAETIFAELDRIAQSPIFAGSDRMIRFLRFVVEQTLAGNSATLKEYVLGTEVFDRKQDYDARIDPIVRVEARRLRAKLASYYEGEGKTAALRIEIPKGTYVPRFKRGEPLVPALEEPMVQAPRGRSIVVLPFRNLGPDPSQDYLGDAITQELIHRLTKIDQLRVVAWTSAARLRDADEEACATVKAMGVSTVLKGSVRLAGNRIRVLAQLVDLNNGVYLWSEMFDRRVEDMIEIEEEISSAIVRKLEVELGGRVRCKPDPEVYSLYLKGRYHWNWRTKEGFERAIEEFKQAIDLDPAYALAWAGLADTYLVMADYSLVKPAGVIELARAAANRALELDPTLGEAEATLGLIASIYEWEDEKAEHHFLRSMELNPGYATSFHWYGVDYLALKARFEEATAAIEQAIRLDPLSGIIRESRGYTLLLARRYEEAIREYHAAISFEPSFYKLDAALGRAYIQTGDYERAIQHLESARRNSGDVPNVIAALAQAHGEAGHDDCCRALLIYLERLSATRHISASCFAIALIGARQYDRALDWLEEGARRRESQLRALGVHPVWDPLRNDKRFQVLLDAIHWSQK